MKKEIKIESRGVTNTRLHQEIANTLYETITTIGVRWASDNHRKAFIEVIEDFFGEMQDQETIQQFRIICDRRNNPNGFKDVKEYVFEAQYKQAHVLNTTKIIFHIPPKK